jgi:hypothetical protein
MQNVFLVVMWTEQATGRFKKKIFTQVLLLKNLVYTFETMFSYLSIDGVFFSWRPILVSNTPVGYLFTTDVTFYFLPCCIL